MDLTKVNPHTGRHLVSSLFGFRDGAKALLLSPTIIFVTAKSPPYTCYSSSQHHSFTYVGSLALHFISIFTRVLNRPISLSLSLSSPPLPRCRGFSDRVAPTARPMDLHFLSKVNSLLFCHLNLFFTLKREWFDLLSLLVDSNCKSEFVRNLELWLETWKFLSLPCRTSESVFSIVCLRNSQRRDDRSSHLNSTDVVEARKQGLFSELPSLRNCAYSIWLFQIFSFRPVGGIHLAQIKFVKGMSSKIVYEGWMVRYGRRKIGRSFIHMRYFVLESRLLAYYKRKPQDNQVGVVRYSSGFSIFGVVFCISSEVVASPYKILICTNG